MSQSGLSERELLLLIEGERAAILSQADLDRLGKALRDDPLAQELYQNSKMLDAELYWRQLRPADSPPWRKNPRDESGNHESGGSLLGSDLGHGGFLPTLPIDLSVSSREESILFEAMQAQAMPPSSQPRSPMNRPVAPLLETGGWMDVVPWRLVGTCVFGLVLVAAMLLDLRPRGQQEVTVKAPSFQPQERYSPPGAVATLISAIDCRWGNRRLPLEAGASIHSERLDLLSGTAEVLFGNGARVVLEGPSSLVVQDAGRALLEQGQLAAQVPKRAIGFTITTPTVEVVDYGTEFGVAVSPEGIVDVAVLVGRVEVGSLPAPFGSTSSGQHEKRVVTAGQAITAHRTVNRPLMIDSASFNDILAASLAKPFESMARLPGKMVAYRVPDHTAGNRRDFHGGVGLDFDVQAPIRVFSLGVFDHLGDGIDPSTSPVVQLWSRDQRGTPEDTKDDSGREMLASRVFTAGDLSELKLGHRFKPLAKPLDLPAGSYSIVVYDLAKGNPFVAIAAEKAHSAGLALVDGNAVDGKVGGTFARNDNESYYGDTNLGRSYTLNDTITASGTLTFANPKNTRDQKFFVGHFSQSTDDDRREFIGMEFIQADAATWLGVRARIYRFNGVTMDDSWSEHHVNLRMGGPCHFDYIYDPNYEADSNHPGPEGRLLLHVYDDNRTIDETVCAVNPGTHRDAGSTFDSFGLGISTMESMEGDDPDSTVDLFLDDVTYSGHTGTVDFNTDPEWEGIGNTDDGNNYGWAHPKAGTLNRLASRRGSDAPSNAIVPIGSRRGESRPGALPAMQDDRKTVYAAGSFEYVPQWRSTDMEGQ